MGYVEFPLTPVCRRLLIAFCIIETIMLCALALRIASRVVQRVKSYGEDILIVFAAVDVTAMLVLFGFCMFQFTLLVCQLGSANLCLK